MAVLASSYNAWPTKVRETLDSINMPMEEWQAVSAFDFEQEFAAGSSPDDAALRANRFWWLQQSQDRCRTRAAGCPEDTMIPTFRRLSAESLQTWTGDVRHGTGLILRIKMPDVSPARRDETD